MLNASLFDDPICRDEIPNHGLRPATPMGTKRKKMNLGDRTGVAVMDLGGMDIWDGADLALIRDTLVRLIVTDRRRRIGVDMTHVKYIPSGFFGMLLDWQDRGVEIFLYDPQPNVRNMLWFRHFAEPVGDAAYRMTGSPQEELRPEGVGRWDEPIEDLGLADERPAMTFARAR